MGLSKLDQSIAEFYAPILLFPVKYGENGVFFWFPSTGMTTINSDIFGSKQILIKNLGGFAKNIKILQFQGNLGESKNLRGLLNQANFSDYSGLHNFCSHSLQKGQEVACVVTGIDDFNKQDKFSILKMFVKLTAINHRRIHILLNLQDKVAFETILKENSEIMVLANRMKLMPIISGDLLTSYILQKSAEYDFSLTKSAIAYLKTTYGGILRLTKEYLRSKGDISILNLKLRIIWDKLPRDYKDALIDNREHTDLKELGILGLKVFEVHRNTLNIDPTKILPKLLTNSESVLWKYCLLHSGKFIDKEKIIRILRPRDSENISMWAIDQAISRFRKKLQKAGIDSSIFKTIKGKGYQWN